MAENPDRIKKVVGRSIARRRREMGLTLEALAERLDASPQYINKCERGQQNLTIESLAKFANALETTVMEMLRAAR